MSKKDIDGVGAVENPEKPSEGEKQKGGGAVITQVFTLGCLI